MDELINKSVMVNPLLTDDPVRMQGQVGIITYINRENDDVHVQFPNDTKGIYSTNALLSLLPKEMVLANVQTELTALDPKEIRILLEIYRLQKSGQPADMEHGLRWGIAFENARHNSMISLQDFIAQGLYDNIELQTSRGR
jgi:hypothetical protein